MTETKAAFAERTIVSLKNILYRYMEDIGYKYNLNLTKFVTTLNSRKKLLDGLDTIECEEVRFFVYSLQQTTTRI